MAKIYAMYKHPADAAAFDRYYYGKHVPLAKTVPGLSSYEVTRGPIGNVSGGSSPYHLIATLTFPSPAVISAALTSPQGQATAADLANFASGGVDLFVAETESI